MVSPTPQQRLAIQYLEGPLCISAGAGSGKTWVLSERFVRAIDAGIDGRPIDVTEALAITFTDKAAGELVDRVRRALTKAGLVDASRRVDEAWISTIHGFCGRILRRNALGIGLDPGFRVIADVEAAVLRERTLAEVLKQAAGSDAGIADLVSRYGWACVGREVLAAHARLMGLGLGAGDATYPLRPAATGETSALLGAALDLLASSSEALRSCGSKGANFETCGSSIDGAVACISDLATRPADASAETAQALWSLLRGLKLPRPAGEGRAVIEELTAEVGSARERSLEIALAPRAEAFGRLVARYGDGYRAAKTDHGVLDFDDLQAMTADALRLDGGLLGGAGHGFRLVMVDEFQDTDVLQARIVDRLGGDVLCTVGDDKQSIYGFRDADVDVFRDHVASMRERGAGSAVLARNFRSHGDVLEAVNAIFSAEGVFGSDFTPLEHGRDESRAPAWPSGLARVNLVLVDETIGPVDVTAAVEAEALARRIEEMVDAGVDQSGVVVLMRSLKAMGPYEDALRRRGFRVTVAGGGDFFGRAEVEWFLWLLRVLANVLDDEALANLLASPLVGVSPDTLLRARHLSDDDIAVSMWDAMRSAAVTDCDHAAVDRLATAVEYAREGLGSLPLSSVLMGACECLDADVKMLEAGLEGEEAFANLLKLARMADSFEASGGSGLAGLLDHLRLKRTVGDPEPPAVVADAATPAIRFMTIHAAKGLEFPVVVLAALGRKGSSRHGHLSASRMGSGACFTASLPPSCGGDPTSRRPRVVREHLEAEARRDAEESKRVFYVGCTRAREALVLATGTRFDRLAPAGPAGWLRHTIGMEDAVRAGRYDAEVADGTRVWVEALDRPQDATAPVAPVVPAASGEDAGGSQDVEPISSADSRQPDVGVRDRRPPGRALDVPEGLSFSRLADAQDCMLGFFLKTMARLGSQSGTDGDARAFGDAVHAVLRLADGRALPSEERIAAIARRYGLDDDGRRRVETAASSFVDSPLASRVAMATTVGREVPFAVPLSGQPPHVLMGSMDLLATEPDGPALVVDYKTGHASDVEARDRRFQLQAMCYALPLLRSGLPEAEVVFALLESPTEDGEPATVRESFSTGDLDEIERRIGAIVDGLECGPYVPKAKWSPSCRSCPGQGALCPVRGPSRR